MPINAPDLPPLVSPLTTQQLMLLDIDTGELSILPASGFRGAGFYTGDTTPSEIHPDADDGAAYQDGDFYVFTDGTSNYLYKWDSTQLVGDRWIERGSLTGSRRHTAETLGFDTYETVNTVINDPDFAAGDVYYSRLQDKTFGPAIAGVGIDFNVENRNYISNRSPRQLSHIGVPTVEMLSHDWSPATITDPLVSAYSPQGGDTYLQKTTLVDGVDHHGGFVFTWDQSSFQLSIDNGDDYQVAFGHGWDTIPKIFYRDPKIFSESAPPTINDLKFITGDTYLDNSALLMYPSYTVGLVKDELGIETDAEFFTRVWGVPELLRPSKIIDITQDEILSVPDVRVGDGDYVILQRYNTPVMYGPYDQVNDPANIPLISTLRSGRVFYDNNAPDGLQSTLQVTGWVAIVGDTYVHTIPTGRNDTYLCTVSDDLNVTWTLQESKLGVITHSLTTRTIDDLLYDSGDYGILRGGMYGPYVEGAIDDITAWPFYTNVRGMTIHTLPEGLSTDTPSTDASSIDLVQSQAFTGDYLDLPITGSTTGKTKRFGPVVVDHTTNTLTYPVNFSNKNSVINHYSTTETQPVRNDDDYSEGDFITTKAGIIYGPYIESAVDDLTAWPVWRNLALAPSIVDEGNVDVGTVWSLKVINGVLMLDDGNP